MGTQPKDSHGIQTQTQPGITLGYPIPAIDPTHLRNLLKITTLLFYLALLVYLAPESTYMYNPLQGRKWLPKTGEPLHLRPVLFGTPEYLDEFSYFSYES